MRLFDISLHIIPVTKMLSKTDVRNVGNIFRILIAFSFILFFIGCEINEETAGTETWSFVVFSDLQQGYGVYGQLAGIIGGTNPVPKLAICCGDVMLRAGNEAEWLSFKKVSKPITDKMPYYLARGNHDGNDEESECMLRQQFSYNSGNFFFSFGYRGCLFIILDTQIRNEEGSIVNQQLEWLKETLKFADEQQAIEHIFIFMHQPLFPQGPHADSPLKNRDELHSLFVENAKIRTIFSGHEHMFNRNLKDGLTYIITGGGGGVLYHGYGGDYHHFTKVSFYEYENRINIKTIEIFNEVIEDFNL